MVRIKCRCGKSEMNFMHLKASDMPQGWECEECFKEEKQEAKQEEAPKAEEAKQEEAPKAEEKPRRSRRSRKKVEAQE